jgi:PAS domain S-box-containing protein
MILVVLIWFNADSQFHMEAREAETNRLLDRQNEDLQRQASLIDHSHDAIFTMDSTRHILSWNRGAQELYQYTAEEAAGKVTHEFLQTKSIITMTEVDSVLMATGRWDGELMHSRRDGKWVTVDSRHVLLRNDKGEVTGILEINRDVTASRAIEEQLRQTQKLESIGQLAAGVAHDFNNLLTVINGYANMLLVEPTLEESLHGEVEEIIAASDRAAEITRQLLAFSRRQVTVRQNFVLNDVVSRMEKMVRRLIGENLSFSMDLEETRSVIYADPGQIEQVVMNLVVNARDAISGIGKIALETGQMVVDAEYSASHLGVKPGTYAVLSVSDTGGGMSAEVKARIFEPFFTTKEKGKGTGLGLSMVYGIVEQNSGTIVVYSEVGKGSTFKILLPVSDGPATGPRGDTVLPSLEGTETILLVEDEEALRDFVRTVLERHGYRVLAAPNGRAGLELAREHHADIHLLLSDVVMPEMGGIELADQIATLYPKIAILHMSGYTERFWVRSEVQFLQKPFTAAGLLTKIRGALELHGKR